MASGPGTRAHQRPGSGPPAAAPPRCFEAHRGGQGALSVHHPPSEPPPVPLDVVSLPSAVWVGPRDVAGCAREETTAALHTLCGEPAAQLVSPTADRGVGLTFQPLSGPDSGVWTRTTGCC